MQFARPLLASLLLLSAGASAATTSAAADAAFGKALSCRPVGVASVLAVAKTKGVNGTEADVAWSLSSMSKIGYTADLPKSPRAREAALSASALLRAGHIVAAKMANDEASSSVPGYKESKFASSFESLLTVLTQPVMHASYPTSVRAEGEQWPADADHSHTHGVDMEKASASLAEIISRTGTAMTALGSTYNKPVVRYYILAHGFRDPIALEASRAGVCALKLDDATVKKLDVSARFMAMPAGVPSGAKK